MCSLGTIPIVVKSCFPVGLGFSYQIQAYTNIGNPIGGSVQLNTAIANTVCVPFFAGPTFVGVQAVSLQTSAIVQTSNLVPVTAGSEVTFTIANDSLRILRCDEKCLNQVSCPVQCPVQCTKPCCSTPIPCPKPSCQCQPPKKKKKPCPVHGKKRQ